MGGGLMQLVAYGAQDIYLTGNPQITFFKVVYRRHTNFAVESIEQTFNGAATLGNKFSCTISRNGDLLSRVYLEIDMAAATANTAFAARQGFQLIDNVEVEIGGQCIDKHYGEWMDIWAQLSHSRSKLRQLNRLVGGAGDVGGLGNKLYVPLQFWFCKNPGLALPLIALQYHEVKINVQFAESYTKIDTIGSNFANSTDDIQTCCVFCDYIFLDTDERRRFAQVSHEYLIEQLQFSNSLNVKNGDNQAELRFNHPVKELVWVANPAAAATNHNFEHNNAGALTVNSALLQLNGHDRFRKRDGSYFAHVQTYEHHSGECNQVAGSAAVAPGSASPGSGPLGGIYCYSFGLKPEEHQPSGTCNFSRIDNAVLSVNTTGAANLRVYAVNYNVLRIMSGMGGLAYSN